MEVSNKSRHQVRLQGWTFVVLFLTVIGLLAWLSTRYNYQADWTASGRHTLSEASTTLLGKLDGPVTITSFSRPDDVSGLRKWCQLPGSASHVQGCLPEGDTPSRTERNFRPRSFPRGGWGITFCSRVNSRRKR